MKQHIVNFAESHWCLMHPLACRPNLFDCPLNDALLPDSKPAAYNGLGYYSVDLDESTATIRLLEKLDKLPENEADVLKRWIAEAKKWTASPPPASGWPQSQQYWEGAIKGFELALGLFEGQTPPPLFGKEESVA
jgi:hypothetical protein